MLDAPERGPGFEDRRAPVTLEDLGQQRTVRLERDRLVGLVEPGDVRLGDGRGGRAPLQPTDNEFGDVLEDLTGQRATPVSCASLPPPRRRSGRS
jgi:hypothetical protein